MSAARGPLDAGRLRARLGAGETVTGTFVGLASVTAAEVVAAAGCDFLVLDLEHGGGTEADLGGVIPVAGAYGAATIVRVETPDRIRIGRALDAGAAGVMLPRLERADDVAEALRHLRYPGTGDRGVASYNRAARWGLDPAALDRSDELLGVVQVETRGLLEDVERVAALDGADVLFVGPLDLGYALGVPRQPEAPEFVAALERVVAACDAAGTAAGILAPTPERARRMRELGFRFVAVGSDSTLLAQAVAGVVAEAAADRDRDSENDRDSDPDDTDHRKDLHP